MFASVMTDKKQTAVEWLVNQVEDFHCLLPVDMVEQALAMEREQIEDAYCNGVIDGAGEILNRDSIKPDAVKYYEVLTCNHEWVMTDQPWKRCKICGKIDPTGKKYEQR